jgi:hypothetical protein
MGKQAWEAAMQPELDKDLLSLFEDEKQSLPEEPFLGNVLKLIEKRRSKRIFMQIVICFAGIACCAFLSPFLIKASIVLSDGLNAVFGAIGSFVDTPRGVFASTICALLLIFISRRQISRFV